MRICCRCYKLKNENEFNKSSHKYSGGLRYDCKLCQHKYANKWYHEKKNNALNWVSPWKRRKRIFIEMYGGRCECCGETEEMFLNLDHINGQNKQNKECTSDAMCWAISKYQPEKYRILCSNCNQATRFGRICPHQIKKIANGSR